MTYDPRPFRSSREERSANSHGTPDPRLRELLSYLRDSCREIATRIDRYLGDERPVRVAPAERERERSFAPTRPPRASGTESTEVRERLEHLRDEARTMSDDAHTMEPARLRLLIEAITAETRAYQARAEDAEEQDLAAKILRTLTAVVSEHRPGHVYGLARHHTADWGDVSRRAREDLANGNYHRARPEDSAGRAAVEEAVVDDEAG